jgi:hypothetical protein
MSGIKPEDKEAAELYFAEVLNLQQKANEPLRISIMLLSFAVALGVEVPPIIAQCIAHNKALCDRMQFMCLPATAKDTLN